MSNVDWGTGSAALAVSAVAPASDELMDGDVVVVQKSGTTLPFGVLQHPGVVQFGTSTCDGALQLARSFARAHKVDLWYRECHGYSLLERYRPLDADRQSRLGRPDLQTSNAPRSSCVAVPQMR